MLAQCHEEYSSVLQCVAECCSVLQCDAVRRSGVPVCRSVLQRMVCCRMLQPITPDFLFSPPKPPSSSLSFVCTPSCPTCCTTSSTTKRLICWHRSRYSSLPCPPSAYRTSSADIRRRSAALAAWPSTGSRTKSASY